jgi:hypothetical protein
MSKSDELMRCVVPWGALSTYPASYASNCASSAGILPRYHQKIIPNDDLPFRLTGTPCFEVLGS